MFTQAPQDTEFSEAWIDGDETARWRSASGHGPGVGAKASGSSFLEVDPGCRLPRHTDSAEETIVVLSGSGTVTVGGESADVAGGGIALVPEGVAHEVESTGEETLRFLALYASADVTTTYEEPVQPSGERERDPVG